MSVAEQAGEEAAEPEERHAGWLELFYDLAFVALVAQLAHNLLGHLDLPTVLRTLALFVPAWWAWASLTFFWNMAGEAPAAVRPVVLADMACLVVMAGGVGQVPGGDLVLFAAGYAASRVLRVVAWQAAARRASRRWAVAPGTVANLTSAALFLVSAFVGRPAAYVLWAAAIAVEVALVLRRPFGGDRESGPTVDVPHLVERFGLFVILVLGENIAQIVSALGGARTSWTLTVTAVVAFFVVALVWWLYFDFGASVLAVVLTERLEEAFVLARRLCVFGHFLAVAALIVLAAGLHACVLAAQEHGSENGAGAAAIGTVCGAFCLYFVNNATLGVVLVRQPRVQVLRWLVPDLAVLALLGFFGRSLPPWVALAVVLVVLVGNLVQGRRRVGRRP